MVVATVLVIGEGGRAQSPPQAAAQDAFARAYENGTAATITGQLTAVVADDFGRGRSELMHFLRDARTGRTFRVQYRGATPEFEHGSVITASGRASGSELYVLAASADTSLVSSSTVASSPTSPTAMTGERRVAVIVANFRDKVVDCSADYVRQAMFADPGGQSVADLYRDSSHNCLTISGDVAGPFTIDASVTEACDLAGWAAKADAAAAAAGMDLSTYQHRMYVMPPNDCPASGFGTLGGAPSFAWVFECGIQGVFTHELGHNFQMDHAATLESEYGDWTDPMGMATFQMRGVNAPHREQLGWIPAERVQRITASGTYALAPLSADPLTVTSPQILKIYKPDTADWYYLSYRIGQGFDRNISTAFQGRLSVHRYRGDGSSTKTTLFSPLNDGQSFSDALLGLQVTMVAHSDTAATVRVDFASSCVPMPMTLSVTPAEQTAGAGGALRYDVSVANGDGNGCTATTINLSGTVMSGWSVDVVPSTLTLAPGGRASVTVTAVSPASAYQRSYDVWVIANDVVVPAHYAYTSAKYIVGTVCTPAAPQVSAAPSDQSGQAATTLAYSVTIGNRDSLACPSSSFAIETTVPPLWTATVSSPAVTLAPGESRALTVSVRSSAGAGEGHYSVPVSARDAVATTHGGAAALGYTVLATPVSTVLPAPTSLAASVKSKLKQIQLTWTGSGAAAAAYRIVRNGDVVGITAGTAWTDSAWQSGATYAYTVLAVGFDGSVSTPSNAATVTLPGNTGKRK
jgi:hypothetical protein